MIRPITENDAEAICSIYNYYVVNTVISFEEEVVSIETMKERIRETTSQFPWLVFEDEGKVVAYAYANTWKTRCAYRYVLESTVYAASDLRTKGIGTQLYSQLLEELKAANYKSVMGVVALPNAASIGLHEKMGFEKVAHFKEVGFKFDQWIDVGYWQKML